MVVSFLQSQIFSTKVQKIWDKSDSFLKAKNVLGCISIISKSGEKFDLLVPYEPIKQNECIPAVNESTILPMVCLALAVTM